MIEDTRNQLRDARERLRASREALAASAAEPAGVATVEDHGNHWLPAPEPAAETAEDNRYIPPSSPEWLRSLLRGMPAWARPPAVSAAALMALTGIRVLTALPGLLRSPMEMADALFVMLLASGAGAVGGLVFSLIRPKLEPLGRLGDHLTGIVCVAVYLGPLMLVMPSRSDDPKVPLGARLIIFVALSMLFGVVVGHTWFHAARKRNSQ